MALVKCRECSRDVSTGAETCPHCGIDGEQRVRRCLMELIATTAHLPGHQPQ
jgi:hypothetical protein